MTEPVLAARRILKTGVDAASYAEASDRHAQKTAPLLGVGERPGQRDRCLVRLGEAYSVSSWA
jgi:hypothetical protein